MLHYTYTHCTMLLVLPRLSLRSCFLPADARVLSGSQGIATKPASRQHTICTTRCYKIYVQYYMYYTCYDICICTTYYKYVCTTGTREINSANRRFLGAKGVGAFRPTTRRQQCRRQQAYAVVVSVIISIIINMISRSSSSSNISMFISINMISIAIILYLAGAGVQDVAGHRRHRHAAQNEARPSARAASRDLLL